MKPSKLLGYRDVLLPGLCGFSAPDDIESDIQVNFSSERLEVKMFRHSTRRLEIRYVTRADLENGSYIKNFMPMLREMSEVLMSGEKVA